MDNMRILFVGRSNVGKSSVIRALTDLKVRVGKRPGVTIAPRELKWGKNTIVDMPGFGYMAGMSRARQEDVKDAVVRYLEETELGFAVHVTDASNFARLVHKWDERGQVPVEIEMFDFLRELELGPILAANKIDKIKMQERDMALDEIADLLDMLPPWRQWLDVVVPCSAKTGEGIGALKRLIDERLSG